MRHVPGVLYRGLPKATTGELLRASKSNGGGAEQLEGLLG